MSMSACACACVVSPSVSVSHAPSSHCRYPRHKGLLKNYELCAAFIRHMEQEGSREEELELGHDEQEGGGLGFEPVEHTGPHQAGRADATREDDSAGASSRIEAPAPGSSTANSINAAGKTVASAAVATHKKTVATDDKPSAAKGKQIPDNMGKATTAAVSKHSAVAAAVAHTTPPNKRAQASEGVKEAGKKRAAAGTGTGGAAGGATAVGPSASRAGGAQKHSPAADAAASAAAGKGKTVGKFTEATGTNKAARSGKPTQQAREVGEEEEDWVDCSSTASGGGGLLDLWDRYRLLVEDEEEE